MSTTVKQTSFVALRLCSLGGLQIFFKQVKILPKKPISAHTSNREEKVHRITIMCVCSNHVGNGPFENLCGTSSGKPKLVDAGKI